MTRSSDFTLTVSKGVRASQPDVVLHVLRGTDGDTPAPLVGLVVSKAVGSAVARHRVSRKLRHVMRRLLGELRAGDRVVIRAKPGSHTALSARLEEELREALRRTEHRVRASR